MTDKLRQLPFFVFRHWLLNEYHLLILFMINKANLFFPMQEAYLWGVRKFLQPDKDAPAQAFIAKMGRFYYKVSNICAV